MGERTEPRERQVWPNAGARPNWQSNMAAVRAGDGVLSPVAVTRFLTVNRGLNRLAGTKKSRARIEHRDAHER